jgi:hypothetical protein
MIALNCFFPDTLVLYFFFSILWQFQNEFFSGYGFFFHNSCLSNTVNAIFCGIVDGVLNFFVYCWLLRDGGECADYYDILGFFFFFLLFWYVFLPQNHSWILFCIRFFYLLLRMLFNVTSNVFIYPIHFQAK